MTYPHEFARGALDSTKMIDEEYPDISLLTDFKQNDKRTDNYAELSINWVDNEDAIEQILKKCKDDGGVRYKAGAVVFSRTELDILCKRNDIFKKNVSYERDKLDDNNYHGNLLLMSDLIKDKQGKKKRDMIAATIITSCFLKIET